MHDLVCDAVQSDSLSDLSSSSESESDYDLSDPEAELAQGIDTLESSVAQHSSVVDESLGCGPQSGGDLSQGGSRGSTSGFARGRSRVRSSRGRASSRGCGAKSKGRASSYRQTPQSFNEADVCELSKIDDNIPVKIDFKPSRSVGPHLPPRASSYSPASLFKLYFDFDIVQKICDSSNEYAERNKYKRPTMYRYFERMEPDKFFAVVGILIHLGYKRIPRYRLMWSPTSLCYDPLISAVLSRNQFESLLSFLHIVDEDTEKTLKEKSDKLCKVRTLNDHLQERCKALYQPNREMGIQALVSL